jgi:hypothetical protein
MNGVLPGLVAAALVGGVYGENYREVLSQLLIRIAHNGSFKRAM